MLALWVRQEAAVFPLLVERTAAQDEMPVKSFAAPIVAVLAVAALIFWLVRLFAPLCSNSLCHNLLFCHFKCVYFIFLCYLAQGLIYIVAMPVYFDRLTL